MAFIRKVPVAISALALGVAALGNLLASHSEAARLACGVIAAALVLLVVLRIVFDFPGVRAELKNPAALAVLPALFMALMLLATYIKPLVGGPALWLWALALGLQFATVVVFLTRHVRPAEMAGALPAWFIVFVGYVVASVTSPAFAMQPLGRALLWIGLGGYAVALPAIAYRVFRLKDLPEPLVPTVAIFAAPPSLCLVGYLAVVDAKVPAVVYTLLALSLLSLLYATVRLPKILSLGFHPSFSALTFPFVISAIALKQSAAFLTATGTSLPALGTASTVATALAALLVAYVLTRYAVFLAVPARK